MSVRGHLPKNKSKESHESKMPLKDPQWYKELATSFGINSRQMVKEYQTCNEMNGHTDKTKDETPISK